MQSLMNISCISFDSYIKPQPNRFGAVLSQVVYLLIPTSNHNSFWGVPAVISLYIFWFLHQTTTVGVFGRRTQCCISFDSYIKPQLAIFHLLFLKVVYLLIPTSNHNWKTSRSCCYLLYIFWFLHQTTTREPFPLGGGRCISFDSYIKPQLLTDFAPPTTVVYLLIPTSNHNCVAVRPFSM